MLYIFRYVTLWNFAVDSQKIECRLSNSYQGSFDYITEGNKKPLPYNLLKNSFFKGAWIVRLMRNILWRKFN